MHRVVGLIAALLLLLAGCGGAGGGVGGSAKTVQRFASVAQTPDDYIRIWGRSPTGGQARQIPQIADEARVLGFDVLQPAAGASAAQSFLSAYRSTRADVLTLVGHNTQGSFRFADGSSVDLSRLSDGPLLAVISCESGRYVQGTAVGLPEFVTYQVAFRTEARLRGRLAQIDGALSAASLQTELDSAYTQARGELNAQRVQKYSLVAAVGTGSVAGISIYARQ